MSTTEHDLCFGSLATDFFLNLMAVLALVALPVLIPTLTHSSGPAPEDLVERLRDSIDIREQLERELAKAESDWASATDSRTVDDARLVESSDQLRLELMRLNERTAAMTKQLADAQANTQPAGLQALGTPLSRTTKKTPQFFILAHHLLLPINRETGHFEQVSFPDKTHGALFTPDSAGASIDDLAAKSSPAAIALRAIKPANEFVFVYLHEDSFADFYRLRAWLRKKRIALGWTPLLLPDRKVMFALDGSGLQATIIE